MSCEAWNAGLIPITAIVLTLDEVENIGPCLNAMRRIDDIVVVDSGSRDETLAHARAARPDARVFAHPFENFGAQRNWALDHTRPRHDWVLFVDADEFCDDPLLDEIAALVASPGKTVGAFVAGRNYFLGRWLRRCTMYPSYQLRLLRLGDVRFRKEGHGQAEETAGPLVYLRESWRHEALSKGLHQWIARHNAYSSEECELIERLRAEPLRLSQVRSTDPITRRRALKRLGVRIPRLRPLTRFLYTYVVRGGFMDGRAGLIYCLLRVAHDIHIVAKLAERHHRARRTGIAEANKP